MVHTVKKECFQGVIDMSYYPREVYNYCEAITKVNKQKYDRWIIKRNCILDIAYPKWREFPFKTRMQLRDEVEHLIGGWQDA